MKRYYKPMNTHRALAAMMCIKEDEEHLAKIVLLAGNYFCSECGVRVKEQGLCGPCNVERLIKEGK